VVRKLSKEQAKNRRIMGKGTRKDRVRSGAHPRVLFETRWEVGGKDGPTKVTSGLNRWSRKGKITGIWSH